MEGNSRKWLGKVFLCICCMLFACRVLAITPDSLEMKMNAARNEGRVVDNLNTAFAGKPTGEFLLSSSGNDLRYAILIYNIDILPDKAVFSAGIAFRESRSNQLVAFNTDQVSFYYTQGLSGPVTLFLLKDVNTRLGKTCAIRFEGGRGNTWARFDCYGLKEFSIKGTALFNNDYFVPLDSKLNPQPDSSLSAKFLVSAGKWDDLLIHINIQPFEIRGLKGYAFQITDAALDLSEVRNPAGIQLPAEYAQRSEFEFGQEFWEGFYLKNGTLTLPAHFTGSNAPRTGFGVQNMIIDKGGFSGNITGNNLLSLEKGNLGGWNISITRIEMLFYRNSIKATKLQGELGLPVLPDTQTLGYTAIIGLDDSYQFSIQTTKTLMIPAMKMAHIKLYPGSFVQVNIDNGIIDQKACLSGRFDLLNQKQTNDEDARMKIPGLVFQGFTISNKAPKINIEWLGLSQDNQQSTLNQFPIIIENIRAGNENGEPFLAAAISLNLKEKISAKAGFRLKAIIVQINGKDKLKFKKLQLEEASIGAEFTRFRFYGQLKFIRKDTVFGDGFSGSIAFTVKMETGNINGNCNALFGNISGHRYWYFDASINLSGGLPIAPGVVAKGFLGGAWHGMRTLKQGESILSQAFGKSTTGKTFIPDINGGLGLRAGMFLENAGKGTFQASAVLEMHFMKNEGLDKILFYGNAEFVNKGTSLDFNSFLNQTTALCSANDADAYISNYKPAGQVSAALYIMLDFTNKVYTGDLGLFINAKKGSAGISGIGKNGFAGRVQLYFSQTNWYVWIGNSLAPVSVEAGISKSAKLKGSLYMMTGNKVLPAPDLPLLVQQLTGYKQPDSERNPILISDGSAFAFGANLTAEAGAEYQSGSLSLYAKGMCNIGTDILLQRPKSGMICSTTGSEPGIDGWMANGKMYAALIVKIGGSFKKIRIDLASISIGAVMAGEGPDPFYGNGRAAIAINLATLKIRADIDFEFGVPCDPVSRKSIADDFITILSPKDNASMVSTLTGPEIGFALPVNTPFKDENGKTYQFKVTTLDLRCAYLPKGRWEYSQDMLNVSFKPSVELAANALHTIEVRIEMQESVNGIWKPVIQNKQTVSETKTISYRTGNAASSIPLSNIHSSWPAINQINFHKSLYGAGRIQLKTAQPSLFKVTGTRVVARFTSPASKEIWETVATENNGSISFSIPSGLSPGRVYRLRLVRQSSNIALTNSSGITPTSGVSGPSSSGISGISGPSGTSTSIQPALLCEFHFRNSNFNTLTDKGVAMGLVSTNSSGNVYSASYNNKNNEYFEQPEWNEIPAGRIQPVMQIQATPWFRNSVSPSLYGLYQSLPPRIKLFIHFFRDTSATGFIPGRAYRFYQQNLGQQTLNSSHLSGTPYQFSDKQFEFSFTGIPMMLQDMNDLKYGLKSFVVQGTMTDLQLLDKFLPRTSVSSGPSLSGTLSAMPITGTGAAKTSFIAPPSSSTTGVLIPVSPAPSPLPSLRNSLIARIDALNIKTPPSGTSIPVLSNYNTLISALPVSSQTLWNMIIK